MRQWVSLREHFRRGNATATILIVALQASMTQSSMSLGKRVLIWTASPEPLFWQGHAINTAIGLEHSLMAATQPPWNRLGITKPDAMLAARRSEAATRANRSKGEAGRSEVAALANQTRKIVAYAARGPPPNAVR